MSKRLNVYKDQKLIYDIVMESSFDKLQEEVKVNFIWKNIKYAS